MTKAEREILDKLQAVAEQLALLSQLILADYEPVDDDEIGEVEGHA